MTHNTSKEKLPLSKIGFGTWGISGGNWKYGWSSQNEKKTIKALHSSFNQGINWVDTAPIYGLGEGEKIVGKALSHSSYKVFISTKCGLMMNSSNKVTGRLDKKFIKGECESSLKRLKREQIDIYFIHWPKPKHQIEEAIETLIELKNEGKIKYLGLSNFSAEQILKNQELLQHLPIYLQNPFNLINTRSKTELLSKIDYQSFPFLAYSPLAHGILGGRIDLNRLSNWPFDDWRKEGSPHFKAPDLMFNLSLVEKLKHIGKQFHLSLSELSAIWILSHKEIHSLIMGIRQPEDVISPHDLLNHLEKESIVAEINKAQKQYLENIRNA